MALAFSTIQALMEQSDIKHQIRKHSELAKFGRIHHVIVAKTHDDDAPNIMTIDEFVDQCVKEYDTWIGEIKSAVAVAVRSGGFVANPFIIFSDSALLNSSCSKQMTSCLSKRFSRARFVGSIIPFPRTNANGMQRKISSFRRSALRVVNQHGRKRDRKKMLNTCGLITMISVMVMNFKGGTYEQFTG